MLMFPTPDMSPSAPQTKNRGEHVSLRWFAWNLGIRQIVKARGEENIESAGFFFCGREIRPWYIHHDTLEDLEFRNWKTRFGGGWNWIFSNLKNLGDFFKVPCENFRFFFDATMLVDWTVGSFYWVTVIFLFLLEGGLSRVGRLAILPWCFLTKNSRVFLQGRQHWQLIVAYEVRGRREKKSLPAAQCLQ